MWCGWVRDMVESSPALCGRWAGLLLCGVGLVDDEVGDDGYDYLDDGCGGEQVLGLFFVEVESEFCNACDD